MEQPGVLETVYVAYYFQDRRKENMAEIYDVYKNRSDAIQRIHEEAKELFDYEGEVHDDAKSYLLTFGGEYNFVVDTQIVR